MASNERTITVTTDDAAIAMIQNATRRLVVIAPAGKLLTCAEDAIEIWRTEA
jgi:hypothetical protein